MSRRAARRQRTTAGGAHASARRSTRTQSGPPFGTARPPRGAATATVGLATQLRRRGRTRTLLRRRGSPPRLRATRHPGKPSRRARRRFRRRPPWPTVPTPGRTSPTHQERDGEALEKVPHGLLPAVDFDIGEHIAPPPRRK